MGSRGSKPPNFTWEELTAYAESENLKPIDVGRLIHKRKNPKKINYFYVLTPTGIAQKTKLTINFMKRKMKEYDELKSELDKDN